LLHITLRDDEESIYIEGEIKNKELFELLKESKENDPIETFVSIVTIGTLGFRRMKVGAELDFVEKKIQEMLSNIEMILDPERETSYLGNFIARIKEYFDRGGKIEDILDPETENTPLGKFVKSLKEYFDSGGKLESLINPDYENSPLGKFVKKLDEYLGRGGRLEELLDLNREESPINKLKKELLAEIKELRDLISKSEGKKEVISRTTLKGYEFEDLCEKILNNAVEFGETVRKTTTEVGRIPWCKKGDFVIELNNGKKITFEVKDIQRISLDEIKKSVKEAMENREAEYGVFVSRYVEALPNSKVRWFNEYGNILVCAIESKETGDFYPEILQIAYQWAKLRIMEKESEIDTAAIKEATKKLEEINESINKLSEIKRQCENAKRSLNKIEEMVEEIESSLGKQITALKIALGTIVR